MQGTQGRVLWNDSHMFLQNIMFWRICWHFAQIRPPKAPEKKKAQSCSVIWLVVWDSLSFFSSPLKLFLFVIVPTMFILGSWNLPRLVTWLKVWPSLMGVFLMFFSLLLSLTCEFQCFLKSVQSPLDHLCSAGRETEEIHRGLDAGVRNQWYLM